MKKRSKQTVLSAAILGLCCLNQVACATVAGSTSSTFTPTQKVAIEQIVHDYLVGHPSVLIEATQALQMQQQKDMVSKAESAIQSHAKALFNTSESPVVGNPKGNVTLVEFFDYQCGVCQRMAPIIKNLIKSNPDLRVVMKEWPIFGATSDYAARAALASAKQHKFDAYYDALVMNEGHLSEEKTMSLAKSVGLDTDQLKKDMSDPIFAKELKNNLTLAEAMHLVGTPAFIIAHTPDGVYTNAKTYFVPGAASEASLNELIQKAK